MPSPRDWLRYPEQFGRVPDARWLAARGEQEPLRRAAMLQHEFARHAREQQRRLDQNTDETAREVDMTGDHLRRIYRGQAKITLDNLYRIARQLDLEVETTVRPRSSHAQSAVTGDPPAFTGNS